MPRISEQLQQALTEGFRDNADFMRTLNTLAKQGGTWKSEKQARFILNTIDGSRWEASPPAAKWAKANRMGGDYLAFADQRIEGFGKRTASKIRITGRLYALDGGEWCPSPRCPTSTPARHPKDSTQTGTGLKSFFAGPKSQQSS